MKTESPIKIKRNNKTSVTKYYCLGALWGYIEDKTSEFIKSSKWENGYGKEKFADIVKSIPIGSIVALKGWNQKFQKRIYLKAIGTVISKNRDGKTLKVDWRYLEKESKKIDNLNKRYNLTIQEVKDTNDIKKIFSISDKSSRKKQESYTEGAAIQVTLTKYERDLNARQACIDHYGYSCMVCGFNFEYIYGKIGKGFIHVHHLVPIAEINATYNIDPVKDLRPLCPNCHAMIHKQNPPVKIGILKSLLK